MLLNVAAAAVRKLTAFSCLYRKGPSECNSVGEKHVYKSDLSRGALSMYALSDKQGLLI